MAYTEQEIQKINETRESNVNQGISAYSGAGVTPFSASQGLGVINSETLSGSATPVNIPPVPTSTAAAELGAYASSVGEQEKERAKLQAEQDAKAQEAQKAVTEEKGKIRSLYDQALGLISGRGEAEKEAGLDVKAQKVTEYTNQMEALDRAETNAYRALEGSGLTDVQRAANQREIQRRFAFQKADVALLQSAANRDYETAFNIVNRKIELALEPIKFQLDYTKTFYEDAKADLTKSEDRAFNLKIAELDRNYEETKTLEKYKGDIALTAMQNGVPIPSYVMSELNKAKDQSEVNSVLARNGISLAKPEDPLDRQIKQAQLAKLQADVQQKIEENRPITTINDPTKTAAENNFLTLQSVFQSSKVSTGNKTSIGNGLALAKAAQDLANANPSGKFTGFSPFRAVTDIQIPFTNIGIIPFRQAGKRSKTIENESLISALDLQTQFWASGAALSEEQTKLVQKMVPTVTDTDRQIKVKVNQLINYMLSQTSSRLVTDGIDYRPAKVDMFETVDLLNKVSPEQAAELRAEGLIQ